MGRVLLNRVRNLTRFFVPIAYAPARVKSNINSTFDDLPITYAPATSEGGTIATFDTVPSRLRARPEQSNLEVTLPALSNVETSRHSAALSNPPTWGVSHEQSGIDATLSKLTLR